MMKRKLLILLFFLFAVYGFSQEVQKLVSEYGGIYNTYNYQPTIYTKAPKGYKPFYISHVGRHGSRYPVDSDYVRRSLRILQHSDKLGVLTDAGKHLLNCFLQLDSLSDGMYGMLCQKGVEEHKEIGRRMVKNFPNVFDNFQRRQINVMSTAKPRCVASAANLCGALAGEASGLDISVYSGNRFAEILCNEEGIGKIHSRAGKLADAYLEKKFDYNGFYERMYTSLEAAYKCNPNRRRLVDNIYANGTVAAYMGYNSLINCLSAEEYKQLAETYNNRMYFCHCNNAETGQWRIHFQDALLKDFIEKADEAIKPRSRVAADLRFSHDVGIMPFLSLIGIKEFNYSVSFEEASKVWNSTHTMCMGTNLQMVLYKNKKQEVLVKFLLQEKETILPDIKAVDGPYYRWEDVKTYWKSKL